MFNLETQIDNSNQQVINLTNTAKNAFTGVNVVGGEFSATEALNDMHNSAMMMFGGSAGNLFGKSASAAGSAASSGSAAGGMIDAGNSFSNTSAGMGMSGSLGLA